MTVDSKTTLLRDFVYLDGDRLHSLYSQAFEGVAEKIVQSYFDGLTNLSTQKGVPLTGSALTTEVAEVSQRTENRVLHDHMYNQFEDRISASLIAAGNLTVDDYHTALKEAFAIKVAGLVEIEDFNRMTVFFDKFNDLGEAIAYASTVNPEAAAALQSIEQSVNTIKDRNERAKAKELVRQRTDVKKLAQSMGLSQDQKLLNNLKLFSEMFARDLFFVTIIPQETAGRVVYRAVLNTKWLRVQPSLLRALYGLYPQCIWTLVGQVTHLPPPVTPSAPPGVASTAGESSVASPTTQTPPSMRDPYRNMFKSSSELEKMFLESHERIEVVVFPLAIYREYKVASSAK
jgi:hypothetical protein